MIWKNTIASKEMRNKLLIDAINYIPEFKNRRRKKRNKLPREVIIIIREYANTLWMTVSMDI